MTLRVTVVDEQNGDSDECVVAEGDYLIICHDPCYEHHVQVYSNGTHVITVKGRLVANRDEEQHRQNSVRADWDRARIAATGGVPVTETPDNQRKAP